MMSSRCVLARHFCPTLFVLENVITNDASITKACTLVWARVPDTMLVVTWVTMEVIVRVGNSQVILSDSWRTIVVQGIMGIHPVPRLRPLKSTENLQLSSTVFKRIWIWRWSMRHWMPKVLVRAISRVNWLPVQLKSNATQMKLTTAAKVRLVCFWRYYWSTAIYSRWTRHTVLLWWSDTRRVFFPVWRLRGRSGWCCSEYWSNVRISNLRSSLPTTIAVFLLDWISLLRCVHFWQPYVLQCGIDKDNEINPLETLYYT